MLQGWQGFLGECRIEDASEQEVRQKHYRCLLDDSMKCVCATLNDLAVIDMAQPGEVMTPLQELRSRGGPYWWLEVSRCTICETAWLIGHEERQNDVFVLRRLRPDELTAVLRDGVWPPDFDQYETLLKLGREAGHSVHWADPVGDSSLLATVTDLAKQRPGIRVSELADLLNIDFEIAAAIAQEASITYGVSINRDDEPWK